MKKFLDKIQGYGTKAEQMRQILEAAPAKAAQFRDAVLATAGQLQILRRDMQSTVAGLRTEGEPGLSAAMNEIQAGADQIREAGYELVGVEMELDPVQRLMLLLEKKEAVSVSDLESLLSANASRRTLYGVLASLIKAEAFAEQFHLGELEYRQLRVSVGPIPAVRLAWKPATTGRAAVPVPTPEERAAGTDVPGTPPPLSGAAGAFLGEGSFFGAKSVFDAEPERAQQIGETGMQKDVVPVPNDPDAPTAVPSAPRQEPQPAPAPRPGATWSASALERFKKMPNLGSRR